MKDKINVAELLKDCPKGMELDCTAFEGVTLSSVNTDRAYPIHIRLSCGNLKSLTSEGGLNHTEGAKCIIFPRGKTTWEGFVPPCKFKNGDIAYIVTDECDYRICIFERIVGNNMHTIASVTSSGHFFCPCKEQFDAENFVTYRLATEEEKAKLFKAIRDNGYKWNAETKTLEELPKFKDGDIIFTHTNNYTWVSILKQFSGSSCCTYTDLCINDNDLISDTRTLCNIEDIITQRLATEEEKSKLFNAIKANGYKWDPEKKTLEKIKPEFKVGDTITNGKTSITIGYIDNEYYYEISRNIANRLPIKNQDEWDLISEKFPNRFNINTLVPFESKVLVRNDEHQYWIPAFWGCKRADGYTTTFGWCKYCIPYEGNEYLLETNNDCNEYYKTWK